MNWYKGIIVILVVTLVGYSAYLNDKIEKCEAEAIAAKDMAMEQRDIARAATIVAQRERVLADSLKAEALRQRNIVNQDPRLFLATDRSNICEMVLI